MKNKLNTASSADPMFRLHGLTLAAVYPGLNCPRCRSLEIGLMMFLMVMLFGNAVIAGLSSDYYFRHTIDFKDSLTI